MPAVSDAAGYGDAMTLEVVPASVAGWPAVEAVFLAEASAQELLVPVPRAVECGGGHHEP